MKRIIINGQFTARRMTGQERFAYEIVCCLDQMVGTDCTVELVVPPNAFNIPPLHHIKVVRYGKVKGMLWEQTFFAFYMLTHKGVSLNLCSIMPIVKPGIICIHDVSYKVNPQYFTSLYSFLSMWWHRLMYNWGAWFSPLVLTVSEYSKHQMEDIYGIKSDRLKVIGNGWDHFERIVSDETLMKRKPELFAKPYFFSLGSLAPHKNIRWIIEVAKQHPQYNFLIGGHTSLKAFGVNYSENEVENVKFLGYISDSEVKALMTHCLAFIFPSFFEGFGIPPLEALSTGAKIIVARASCLPEILGDSAYYINPYDTNINLNELLSQQTGDVKSVLEKYRFDRFAKMLYDILRNI